MTRTTRPLSPKTLFRAAALALIMGAATFTPLAPVAMADVTASDVRGTFVAENNPNIVNDFVMDIFGGLEVTPIRDGRRGTTVIYESVSDGKWQQAGLFRSSRATYEYTPAGAFVWSDGSQTITLWRTGRDSTDVNNYVIDGRYNLDGSDGAYNVFSMSNSDTVRITPYRNGREGGAVTYTRTSADTFKATNSAATYTVLPDGDLLWESNDSRNVRISLSPR